MTLKTVDLTKELITKLPIDLELEVQTIDVSYKDKPTALAIILGVTADSVINASMKDGGEVVCDKTTDDSRFRGFTIQDMVDICLMQGLAVTEVDLDLGDNPPKDYLREAAPHHTRKIVDWDRFENELLSSRGLAIYHIPNDNLEHALAYFGSGTEATLVDPAAEIKVLYRGRADLIDNGVQLISLLRIDKVI